MSDDEIGAILHRLFIGREGTSLRREDLQKVHEVRALVAALGKVRRGAHLVDAAAGKSAVGLIAAELLPIGRLTIIERDPRRVAAARAAVTRLGRPIPVEIREADVDDEGAWPEAPDAVVALHACGAASDRILAQAARVRARFVFVVPCCYGGDVPGIERALDRADRIGAADHVGIRRRLATALVDLERTLRLEAAGYEVETTDFVGATVTPHNLLLRGRRTMNEARIARARARLEAPPFDDGDQLTRVVAP
jgi:hypothetical protein